MLACFCAQNGAELGGASAPSPGFWLSESGLNLASQSVCRERSRRRHSTKQTWNLKRGPVRTIVLFEGLLFRFHVGFAECAILLSEMSVPLLPDPPLPQRRRPDLLFLHSHVRRARSVRPGLEVAWCHKPLKFRCNNDRKGAS